MYRVQSLAIFAVRTIMGVGLGGVLSVAGIGVAWVSFRFVGFQSINVWLSMLMVGAGIGAGLGNFAAWLRLEGDTRLVLLATASLAAAAGIGGAWAGYEFGARQEVECCAMPTLTPVTYTAAGATLVASGAVMVSSLVRETLGRWRHVRIDNHAV